METKDKSGMLDLISSPAFCVKDGVILGVNQPAAQQMISVGTPIADLISTGADEYAGFAEGCLYLTLTVGGISCSASVQKVDGYQIFILEQQDDQAELRAMALAAQALRTPLANIMTVAERLFPLIDQKADENSVINDHIAHINRGLYQMLRVIGNMSDAVKYDSLRSVKYEVMDVCNFLAEVFQRANALTEQLAIEIVFKNLSKPVYCMIDSEKLERAVYNILSNAIKFTGQNGKITASLTQRDQKLYLSVVDGGNGTDASAHYYANTRFQRSPGIEDGRFGIGLGMVLIRSTAAMHGGTVLIDQPDGAGMRVTMTLKISQDKNAILRSPLLRVDYTGERDHGLIELSQNLPASSYMQEQMN